MNIYRIDCRTIGGRDAGIVQVRLELIIILQGGRSSRSERLSREPPVPSADAGFHARPRGEPTNKALLFAQGVGTTWSKRSEPP